MLYLSNTGLEKKLSSYTTWYNVERPNSGLGLRTPEQVFREDLPRRQDARKPGNSRFVSWTAIAGFPSSACAARRSVVRSLKVVRSCRKLLPLPLRPAI